MIGRYQEIGQIGGSADVYSAIDVEMGRRVVIKVLPVTSSPPTAPIVHRNVVTVYEVGEHEGRPFLVMELLDGATLADSLEQGEPRSLDQKINLALQVCDGLQAAHDRGVAHGGLTPHRVFVQKDGSVKLLDVALGAAGDRPSDLASAVALFGTILGADAPQSLKDVLAKPPASVAELRADIAQACYVRNSGQYRTQAAAFDRYKKVEALIDERRSLGHQLKVAGIDRICDHEAARLAERFPAFARSTVADLLPVSEQEETAALAELQSLHNEQLATVAVLRTASGQA